MSIRVGLVGISGFGGGEAMRLIASHPSFELVYAGYAESNENLVPTACSSTSRAAPAVRCRRE